jgi:hypothetical protein
MPKTQSWQSRKRTQNFFRVQLFRVRQIFTIIVFLTSLPRANMLPVSAAAGSTRVMCENDASLVGCWRLEEGSGTTI